MSLWGWDLQRVRCFKREFDSLFYREKHYFRVMVNIFNAGPAGNCH